MVKVSVTTSWTLWSVGFSRLDGRMALGPSQEGSFVLSPLPHITQGSGHLGPRTHSSAFIQSQSKLASYLQPYILLPPFLSLHSPYLPPQSRASPSSFAFPTTAPICSRNGSISLFSNADTFK